jgi:DNA repair exonuclease SbcCD ATPase subunit
MSLSETLAGVKAQREKREQKAAAAYRELVKELAAEQAVKPAQVDQVLQAAGKTVDDLEKAVAEHLERAKLRKIADDLPEAIEEQKAATIAFTALQQQIAETTAENNRALAEADTRFQQAVGRVARCKKAREHLRQAGLSAVDPALLNQREQLKMAWAGERQKKNEIEQAISHLEHEAGDLHATINGNQPGLRGASEARLKEAEEKLAGVREQIQAKKASLQQQVAQVARREAQLQEIEEQIVAAG